MRKPTTRLFALVLCVLLLVSQLGLTDSVAVETEDPAEPVQTSEQVTPPELTEQSEPAEEPVADPVEEPAEEPAEVPEAEVTEAPAPEITEAPAPEITEAPVPEVTEAPVAEVTEAPVAEVTEAPAPEVTEAPAPEVIEAPAPEVTEAPAPEVTEAPAEEPVADEEPEPEIATIAGIMPMALLEASVTLSAVPSPSPAVAGTAIESITLTVTEGGVTFADPASALTNFTLNGAGLTDKNPSGATLQAETNAVVLTFDNCIPTEAGKITVTVQSGAFEGDTVTEEVTAEITVNAPDVKVTASAESGLKAGESGSIKLTAEGSVFADSLSEGSFTVKNGDDVTLTPSITSGQGTTEVTLSVTPVKSDNITIEIAKAAFKYQPSANVNAGSVSVTAADDPQVSASPDQLKAGVSGGTIELTINGGNNTFTSTTAGDYTLSGYDSPTLTVNSVSLGGDNKTATVKINEAPTKAGTVNVKIAKKAFTYQPENDVTINGVEIEAAADPEVTANSDDLYAGNPGGTITLSAKVNFASDVSAEMFSFDEPSTGVAEGLSIDSVGEGAGTSSITLNITGTPKEAGDLTVKIDPTAFTYQPGDSVTAKGAKVAAPTGTIKAELVGDLYAGTEVNGQTITVSITDTSKGLKFKSDLSDKSAFTLSENGTLAIQSVSRTSDTEVTLNLSGTPDAQGKVTVTAQTSAFDPAAGAAIQATGDITVNAAPAVTLTAETGTITAGIDKTITIKISSGDTKFVGTDTTLFTLSGIDPLPTLNNVSINTDGDSKTATLTLDAAPSKNGTLTVKVGKAAFDPVAGNEPTTSVTVEELTGKVTASTSDTFTAGTEATGSSITLTIDSGKLTFKNEPFDAKNDFQLGEGSEGLSIESVSGSGTSVTLTLSGTPEKGGSFDVTANVSAFAVPPTDGKDRSAGTITVNYPEITLEAKADSTIYEDEDISGHTITLTATNGKFKATSGGTTGFSVDGISDISVATVTAVEGSNEATLTLSGTPEEAGDLTITVEPSAFQYQPQNAVNATVEVAKPHGSITATLSADLYKGTPVINQTITVSIGAGSHGLEFNPSLDKGAFTLTPECGLKITTATLNENGTVTLTLEGTPTVVGSAAITVTALSTSAFKFTADKDETATIEVKAAPTITLTVAPTTAVQGLDVKTITLTADGGTFANPATKDNFTLTGVEGLSVSTVEISNEGKTATLTVTGAPASTGTLTVTAKQAAFVIYPASDLTAEISVVALTGTVSAKLNNGPLTAGTAVTTQTITLEIKDTNGLTFAANVEAGAFTLGPGSEDLEIESVDKVDDKTVTLKLKGIPAAQGEFTVTAETSAFTVAPTDGKGRMSTNKISIDYPTIELSAAPKDVIYEGVDIANNLITVTATGGVFNADALEGNITISGHTELEVNSVYRDSENTVILTLRGTPSTTDNLTITIKPGAFTYQPEKDLTATVKVNKPTGTVTATLNGDPLYAGTPVNGQTVTLTIGESSHGLQFLEQLNATTDFALEGDATDGLTIESVTRVSDTEVTLTLSGTPTTEGTFTVDALEHAFTYDPGTDEPAGTFTVNPAPEITVTAAPASVTAGLELGTVTITAENGTFLSQLGTNLFTISSPDGIAEGMEITGVTVVDDATVTLTVTGAPAKDGTLIITVDREAFVIRPESSPEAKIAVAKLTGSVSMALAGGTLTAGTAADGLTLELEAAGEGLTFSADAAPGDFLLTGPGAEGLTVASVTRTDGTHVTLTLKGVPAKAGELGVTVKTTAFDVPPTDGQDVTAAPSVTVAYPTVSLTPAPASVSQGVAIETITLTAEGGVFNAIDGGTDGFAISGVTGVTLVAVSAKDGGDTATLTITGAPEQAGTLTVTVQPEAFKYQPEKAVTAAITVTAPTGTVAAALSDALYAYTPVAGQTITVTISDSKGLSFKDGLTPDSFQLTGPAAEGLTVTGVTGSGSAVTLTLGGTPAAGSFTVTALANAFTFDPGKDMDAGTVSVNPAPEVSVTAEPETITVGEDVGTITITAVGGTFSPTADASLFALSGYGANGLTISAVTVNGSTATITITGTPENVGTMTLSVSRAAFSPVAADDPTVEITVRAGSISTDVETGDGAPATSFGSTVDDLADAVLDPEEQALLAEGATVTITLQEEDISDSVGAADKAAAEAAAGSYAVGAYLDLSLFKSVNDKQSAVHETNKPIVIVISVPTNLQSANRVFAVVRVHDGTGTMLNDLDSNPNTITIATDRFSTYAIVYRDGSATTPTPAPPAPSASTTPTAPDTGDEAAPALWLGLLALCAGALVLAGGLLRRRSGTR